MSDDEIERRKNKHVFIDVINDSKTNNIETNSYPINYLLPSINLSIDSTRLASSKAKINIKQTNRSSTYALTITFQPVLHHKTLERRIDRKRFTSSLSLTSMTKTIDTLFNSSSTTTTTTTNRWATFKDFQRKLPSINNDSMTSTPYFPSGTLIELYRHRKEKGK